MKNMRSILLILGIVTALVGIIVIAKGNLMGILLLLAGFGLIVAHSALMMRTGGYRAEGAFFNGLGGQGRQQSEISKNPDAFREPTSNIWDELEKK